MKVRRKSFLALALTASFLLCGETELSAEHPYHVSFAEIEFNEGTRSFEIALCLWAEDLEAALTLDEGKPFDLDRVETKEAEKAIAEYVRSSFGILVGDKSISMKWHGHELEKRKLWVYVEFPCEKQTGEIKIVNRLLLEQHEQQANLMQIKFGKKQVSLTSTAARPEFALQGSK